MRQFNYFGANPTAGGVYSNAQYAGDSEDVELLEREIESVIMRKGVGTAVGGRRHRDSNIVNMTTTGNNFNKDNKRVLVQ